MALKARITEEEFATLGESLQGEYSKKGEEYVLQVEGVKGWGLDDFAGMRKALEDERAAHKKTTAQLKRYAGRDPDEIAGLEAELEKLRSGNPSEKARAEIESVKKQLAEAHEKEKAKLLESTQSIEAQLQKTIVESAAAHALAKHKGDADLLMPHIFAAAKAVKSEDGKYALRVLDNGQEIVSTRQGSNGAYMDLDEFVESRLRQRFPAAFEGSGASGSGATGSARSGSGAGQFSIAADVARKDPRAYQRVRDDAAKAGQTVTIVE